MFSRVVALFLLAIPIISSFPIASARLQKFVHLRSTETVAWDHPDATESAARLPTSFPNFNMTEYAMYRSNIDVTKLEPDDPYFMDMPWPKSLGPEANAFARHLQWRRNQSQGDLQRWIKWAVYQRNQDRSKLRYNVDDFISQNLLKLMSKRMANSDLPADERDTWHTVKKTIQAQGQEEVEATMRAYYAAFSKRDLDELRAFILPDDRIEVMFPGYGRVRGVMEVHKLYSEIMADCKPVATVHPKFVFARTYGTLAVVITKENIGKSLGGLYGSKIKLETSVPTKGGKRAIAVTVLRYVNQQWRIMVHHCSPFRAINPPPPVESKTPSPKNALQSLLRGEKGKKRVEKVVDSKKRIDSAVSATAFTPKQEELLKMIDGRDVLFGTNEASKARQSYLNGIDAEASVNRQTIQALRKLVSSGLLSKEEKDALLYSMVESAASKKESLVETSFKLIYGQRVANEMVNQQAVSAALQDFADQCSLTAQQLQKANKA